MLPCARLGGLHDPPGAVPSGDAMGSVEVSAGDDDCTRVDGASACTLGSLCCNLTKTLRAVKSRIKIVRKSTSPLAMETRRKSSSIHDEISPVTHMHPTSVDVGSRYGGEYVMAYSVDAISTACIHTDGSRLQMRSYEGSASIARATGA
eukprot:scaffold191507_cov37-Tisochrysis_lutea.AAC.2